MIIDRLIPIVRWSPARSWLRSLAKTLTWRLFATVDTFMISVLVTKNLKWASSIVGIELLTKMSLYLLHERAWARVSPGASPQERPITAGPPPRPAFGAVGIRCLAVHVHDAARSGTLN